MRLARSRTRGSLTRNSRPSTKSWPERPERSNAPPGRARVRRALLPCACRIRTPLNPRRFRPLREATVQGERGGKDRPPSLWQEGCRPSERGRARLSLYRASAVPSREWSEMAYPPGGKPFYGRVDRTSRSYRRTSATHSSPGGTPDDRQWYSHTAPKGSVCSSSCSASRVV